nr:putative reverse transcriptase, RNA-dependent DNA polymerase [Tanacetum cinerariifolium]
SAGTQDNLDAGNYQMQVEHVPKYFVLPLWSSYTSTFKCSTTKNGDEKLNEDTSSKTNKEPVDQEDQAFLEELEKLKRQEKEANDADETLRKTFAQNTKDLFLQAGDARASSTNYVNTLSTPVNNASTPVKTASLSRNVNAAVPNNRIFTSASYDVEGAVADFTNLETFVNIEPKKTSQALEDESWVDAMQEELLQFKTQQVWILVDLPFGKKIASTLIETKKPLVKDAKAVDVDVHLYRSMISSLMYLTASRLDIMKSTTRGCQFLDRRLITWQCKKQTIVATSTTEAEYVAAVNCCGQVL